MLSEADRPLIETVLGPLMYRLENGVVTIDMPTGSVVEHKIADGSAPRSGYPTPDEIEAKVEELRILEHRWKMSPAFIEQIVLHDNVSIQAGRNAEREGSMGAWRDWMAELTAQFDAAQSPADVKLRPWPPMPAWFDWNPALRDYAERLGHPDARK